LTIVRDSGFNPPFRRREGVPSVNPSSERRVTFVFQSQRIRLSRGEMATNANPFVVNIVPLQGIATGITSSSDTAGQRATLQATVGNIQTMVDYETHTLSTDYITSFTHDQTIEITQNINLSSASLYQNGVLVTGSSGSMSTISAGVSSFITCGPSTISVVSAGNNTLQISSIGIWVKGSLNVSENAYVKNMYQTSDRELKTDIKPFTTCLDDILKLEPYTFSWKDSGDRDLGFIAQDVQAIWPSLSEGNSIAYSRFVPVLLEGIRELHGRVSTLEGSIGRKA
jgi:hypothetical protein